MVRGRTYTPGRGRVVDQRMLRPKWVAQRQRLGRGGADLGVVEWTVLAVITFMLVRIAGHVSRHRHVPRVGRQSGAAFTGAAKGETTRPMVHHTAKTKFRT